MAGTVAVPTASRRASGSGGRLLGLASVVAVLAGVWLAGLGLGSWVGPPPMLSLAASRPAPPARTGLTLHRSLPTRVRIPSIGVDAPVVPLGKNDRGAVEVPPLSEPALAGWYSGGPAPGEFGPSVVLGHVDTRTGPAVFYRLGEVRPGARIEVLRRDGRVAVFRVYAVSRFPKDGFPTAKVFAEYREASLRIITCGGPYVGGDLGYADNVVVFASLVGSRAA